MIGGAECEYHGVPNIIKKIPIEVESSDTIQVVKEKIQDKFYVPPEKQRLLFAAKILENDWTVSDYGIQEESVVYMLERKG